MLPPNFHGDCYHEEQLLQLRRSFGIDLCIHYDRNKYSFTISCSSLFVKQMSQQRNYFKNVEFWSAYSLFLDMSLKLVLRLSSLPTIYHI